MAITAGAQAWRWTYVGVGILALYGVSASAQLSSDGNYHCTGDYASTWFSPAAAKDWSELFTGDDSYSTDPCAIITDPVVLSDGPAPGPAGYSITLDSGTPSEPNNNPPSVSPSATAKRNAIRRRANHRQARARAAPAKNPDGCTRVTAHSKMAQAGDLTKGGQPVNIGYLTLDISVCYKGGKILFTNANPQIDPKGNIMKGKEDLGWHWNFAAGQMLSKQEGITLDCDDSQCTVVRIRYRGQLYETAKGAAGAGIGVPGTPANANANANVEVNKPGPWAEVTIRVRASDGLPFCSPDQHGVGGGSQGAGPLDPRNTCKLFSN